MRVLHVSEAEEPSGGALQLLELAGGLAGEGIASALACRPGSALDRAARERGLATHPVALRQDYDLASAWRLASLARSGGFEVLHAHHPRAHGVCLAAKALARLRDGARAPALVVSRRVSFRRGRNPFSRWKYSSRLVDAYAAVAGAVRDLLVEGGVDPARVTVIHSGVDLVRFAPRPADQALARELGGAAGPPLIGKIANASPWKGQATFLRAAGRLAPGSARFLLAGRDTDSDWVRREAARAGVLDRVAFLGFRPDVPELLSCLSVSVNAATAGEGLSGALRESLAMGIPVVAADLAGNRELLGPGGDPYLFAPGDSKALAERLDWVLENLDQARLFARAARARLQDEFSVEQMVRRTAALYRSLAR